MNKKDLEKLVDWTIDIRCKRLTREKKQDKDERS